MSAPSPPAVPRPAAPTARPPTSAHGPATHVRATLLMLALFVVVGGVGYPLAVTGAAQLLDPGAAGGSLLNGPNGTIVGSVFVAQNLSLPYLFWPRPSLTDYQALAGVVSPPGPTDPALRALINETLAYMRQYGDRAVMANLSVPLTLVTPSGSMIDPDITPEAALVQIFRLNETAPHPSIVGLTALVNAHIQRPPVGVIGPEYVNVLELDIALLQWLRI